MRKLSRRTVTLTASADCHVDGGIESSRVLIDWVESLVGVDVSGEGYVNVVLVE